MIFLLLKRWLLRGDKIIAVGSNNELRKLAGENTELLDLKGATVLPGINDAHCHLNGFGLERPPMLVDLKYPTIKSMEDIKAATAAKVAEVGPGKWISGWGWDRGFLAEFKGQSQSWPTRFDIDPVSPHNPVVYTDFSGHVCLANSKALEMAKIDKNTPNPDNGIIQKDASGEPTGILFEMAAGMLRQMIPPPTDAERKDGILNAMAELNSLGITCVTEPGLTADTDPDLYRSI